MGHDAVLLGVESVDTYATVRPITIPSAREMTRMKPCELFTEVCAVGLRRGDDLNQQHRYEFVEVFEQEVLLLLRK